ncbi:hypothetical protein ACS76_08880 [Pantoea vagans]|nr:hypothetical protein ACS76_08880 [Pantoea vagans]
MSREIKADTETRDLVSRETTVKATDRTTVIGMASLMAGAIQHVTTGNYSVATQQSQLITVGAVMRKRTSPAALRLKSVRH